MAGRQLSIEGFILSKETTGESHSRYQILADEKGLMLCLKRRSNKPSVKTQPDIFDYAAVELDQSAQGKVCFMRDFQLLKRYQAIGNDYKTFFYASDFSRILIRTLMHADFSPSVFQLFAQALVSWESNIRPEAVFFKSLYLFVRKEGYPIKEQWWKSISHSKRDAVASILKYPINEQEISAATIESLNKDLKKWVSDYTDILI